MDNETPWALIIDIPGKRPTVVGPFTSEAEALRHEDRYVDAPEGSMAHIVPMWAPADVAKIHNRSVTDAEAEQGVAMMSAYEEE